MLRYSALNTELYFDTNSQTEFVHLYHTFLKFYPLFINTVPVLDKEKVSIINPTNTGPTYFKESQIIFLNVDNSNWNDTQFIFQLAHELCHYYIQSDENLIMKWFEETICDLSSLFFLNEISKLYANEGDTQNHHRFQHYLANCMTDDDFETFSITLDIDMERYDRKKQRYLAIQLLPIFERYPLLWKEIPSLINSNSHNLNELLEKFDESIPGYLHEAKIELLSLFKFNR